MQIGFNAPTSGPLIEPDSLTRIITEGEVLGFDYVTVSDHIMVPRNLDSKYPYTDSGEFPAGTQAAWLEQLATTAYIAALTKKLRFVLSVMVVPHRPAVLTAKLLSTIDFLSKGRLTLGIGVGWCREEFEAIGAAPFDDRGHVTDEWMAACKELWTADLPKFSGKYVKFDDVVFTPKPVQQPIPIWVGGESAPALRRTIRYAQGWYPVGTNPQFPMNTVSRLKAALARFPALRRRAAAIRRVWKSQCGCWPDPEHDPAERSTARATCSAAAPRTGWATSRRCRITGSAQLMSACSAAPRTQRSTTCAASVTR